MSTPQEIESRVNIVDIVSRYLPLKKAGANYKAVCPFHNDSSPSLMVSPAKNIAYCFACHTGGGPIRFIQLIEKIEYREALELLAKEAGIQLPKYSHEQEKAKKDLYDLYERVTDFYHRSLLSEAPNGAPYHYLRDRGLTDTDISHFLLGYSGDSRALLAHVASAGYTSDDLIEAGIFVARDRDKFLSRVVFPIFNHIGHPIAFTARTLSNQEPKYLNSPQTKIFTKGQVLYPYHLAKSAIVKKGYAIVVEGQMDALSLHSHGITESVAISGSALTSEQVHLLKRLTGTIYLALDADEAGQKATLSSIEVLMQNECEIRIVTIPNGKDPDDFVKSGGDFRELLSHARSAVSYYLEVVAAGRDTSNLGVKIDLVRSILRCIKPLKSQLERDIYIREVAACLDLTVESLYAELKGVKAPVASSQVSDPVRLVSQQGLTVWVHLASIAYEVNEFDDFFTWFSATFSYTPSDWDEIPGFSIFQKVVDFRQGKYHLSNEDEESLKIISLKEQFHIRSIEQIIDSSRPLFLKCAREWYQMQKHTMTARGTLDPHFMDQINKHYHSIVQKLSLPYVKKAENTR